MRGRQKIARPALSPMFHQTGARVPPGLAFGGSPVPSPCNWLVKASYQIVGVPFRSGDPHRARQRPSNEKLKGETQRRNSKDLSASPGRRTSNFRSATNVISTRPHTASLHDRVPTSVSKPWKSRRRSRQDCQWTQGDCSWFSHCCGKARYDDLAEMGLRRACIARQASGVRSRARQVDLACSARFRRPGRGHGCGRAGAVGLFATQSETSCRMVLRLKQESRSTDAAAVICRWPGHRRPVRKTRPGKRFRQAGRQAAHSAPNTTATTRANAAAMANRSIVDVQAIVTSVG